MTQKIAAITSVGDHDYLVDIRMQEGGEDVVTLRVRADPALVASIGRPDSDESRVVAATIAYLIERQRADDLPADVDLEDVAAAYDGYIEHLHDTLG